MGSQVVILAAGKSSRFFPFNQHHKSLTSIYGKPILIHTLESVARAGIKQAIVVTSPNFNFDFSNYQISQKLSIKTVVQSKALGQANAILTAREHINSDCFVINCQHLTFDQIYSDFTQQIHLHNPDVASLRTTTNTPQKYGVLKLNGNQVTTITEKPKPEDAPSNWRLVGTYYLTQKFLDFLSQTKTEEYQLEAALNEFAKTNKFYAFTSNLNCPSLKYSWDLLTLKDVIAKNYQHHISDQAQIAPTATLKGDNITIKPGAVISDYATIEGPAYIGQEAVVGSYSLIRKNSVLESGAQAQRYADIKNSILLNDAHIHSGFVGDSIIGSQVRIGAGFITANLRLDRHSVSVNVKNKPVDSSVRNIGCFVGPQSKLGIRVSTMPGTVLGPKTLVGPGVIVKGTHPGNQTLDQSNL